MLEALINENMGIIYENRSRLLQLQKERVHEIPKCEMRGHNL